MNVDIIQIITTIVLCWLILAARVVDLRIKNDFEKFRLMRALLLMNIVLIPILVLTETISVLVYTVYSFGLWVLLLSPMQECAKRIIKKRK